MKNMEVKTVNGVECLVYVPENCSSSTNIIVYNDGNGGGTLQTGSLLYNIDKTITTDTNSIIVVPLKEICVSPGGKTAKIENYSNMVNTVLTGLQTEYGVNPANTINVGFSGGGGNAAEDYASQVKTFGVGSTNTLVLMESHPEYVYSEDVIQSLKENNTTLVFINGDGKTHSYLDCSTASRFKEEGINIINIEYNGSNLHGKMATDTINNGLMNFLSGGDLSNIDMYTFKKYEDGKWVELTSEEKAAAIKQIQQESANYNTSKIDPTTLTEGTVASDLYKVYNSMSEITQSISENANYSSGTISLTNGDKTASIPGDLLSTQKGIMSISSGVLGNLGKEAALIQEAANTIYLMDTDLAKVATTLDAGSDYANSINETLNTLINTNINTEITIPNFLFNAGGNTTDNMGILNASDIKSMYSGGKLTGTLAENFNSERENANTIKSKISDFQSSIGTGKTLSGNLWDQIRAKLGTYDELMDKRIESMNKLEEAYKQALKLLDDYMTGYDELDPSKLPEIKTELDNIKTKLEYSKTVINATKQVTDKDGKTKTEFVYSASARAAAAAYIEYANAQIPIIEAFIAKLEGLPEIMSEAEQIINDVLVGIYTDYGVQASNVVTGKSAQYIPPTNTSYKSDRISESEFNRSTAMQNTYGSYENYKNNNIINFPEYSTNYVNTETKDAADTGTQELEQDLSVPTSGIVSANEYAKKFSSSNTNDNSGLEATNNQTGKVETANPTTTATTQTGGTQSGGTQTGSTGSSGNGSTGSSGTGSYGSNSSGSSSQSSETGNSSTESSTTTSSNETTSETDTNSSNTNDNSGLEATNNQTGKVETSNDTTQTETNINESTQNNEVDTKIETTVDDNKTIPIKSDTNNNKSSSTIPVYKNVTKKDNSSVNVNNNETDVNAETPVVDDSDIIEPIEEPIIDEPIEEPIIEPIIEIVDPIEIKPIEPTVDTTSNSKSNSALKTIGIIAGAGAAIGAAAFGAHTITKARENNESSYYESDEEKQEESYE